MKISATELANDSKSVLERVMRRGDVAEVQRHGKAVIEIRRKVGADRREMLELLAKINFTKAKTRELKQAIDAASQVLG